VKGTKSEDTKTLKRGEYDLFTKSSPVSIVLPSNRIVPGDSSEDRRLQREREAERAKLREVQAREASPSLRYDRSVKVIGYSKEQCVQYYKRMTGNYRSLGYAGRIKPQGYEPRVGAGALEKRYGHISVIVAIQGSYLVLHDTNWVRGAVTERVVPISSQRGYIY
jgi:hypothetical protein